MRSALELIPRHAHPMNVMLAAVALQGTLNPEKDPLDHAGQRDIFDALIGSLGPILLYWSGRTGHDLLSGTLSAPRRWPQG
jgi:2-methylcitrate synthase